MTLHIFNPDHDLALAANQTQYTAPHAGRQLRADLGWIPALWASAGDRVLVENVEGAREQARRVGHYARDVEFVTLRDLTTVEVPLSVSPWGWNRTLRHQLRSTDNRNMLVPSDGQLSFIRQVSCRKWAATHLLPRIVKTDGRLVGKAEYVTDLASVEEHGLPMVLKAPWSSSGRGVRYIDGELTEAGRNWIRNVIDQQGGIMVEPYYNKVKDFGMEFSVDEDGVVNYLGLSLFATRNGAYLGNVLATEEAKREVLTRYVASDLIDALIRKISTVMRMALKRKYTGLFGVDMMVVRQDNRYMVHPCVELNLRRTMGHVALALTPKPTEPQRLMQIYYDGNHYHLRILQTGENLLNIEI